MGQWGRNQWNSFNFPWNPCLLIGMTEMMEWSPNLGDYGTNSQTSEFNRTKIMKSRSGVLANRCRCEASLKWASTGSSLVPVSWYLFQCMCVSGINSPGKTRETIWFSYESWCFAVGKPCVFFMCFSLEAGKATYMKKSMACSPAASRKSLSSVEDSGRMSSLGHPLPLGNLGIRLEFLQYIGTESLVFHRKWFINVYNF